MAAVLILTALPLTFCQLLMDGFVTSPPSGANQRSAQHSSGAAASGGWKSATWRAIRANTTAQLADPTGAFRTFKAGRRRRYRDAKREKAAQAAFTTNLEFIVAENAKGTNPFVLGVTNLSDLSFEEFKAQYLMAPQKPPADVAAARQADAGAGTRAHLHRKGSRGLKQSSTISQCGLHWGVAAYNPVGKNVGGCGSCWAFGAAAQLESWVAMQNYTMDEANFLDLSEQMLVDCSYAGYDGCAGGWPTAAWDYIKANVGLASEAVRPYTSGGTGTWTGSCPTATAPRSLGSAIMNDYNLVLPQNDDGLSAALQTQPVFTAVAAGPEFQNYAGGAITCSGTTLTHAIQTFGCGYLPSPDGTSHLPVYVIKNQWSAAWGYGGFAYVLRTTDAGAGCMLAAGAYTLS